MKTINHWSSYPNSYLQFCEKVYVEKNFAEKKFPNGKNLLAALMEEVGELAEALLKIEESGHSPEEVYKEGIQVAAIVYRLIVEGEETYKYNGTRCHFSGCYSPCTGGPCQLCYE